MQGSNAISANGEIQMVAMQRLRRRFEPLLRRVFHLYWRFARA